MISQVSLSDKARKQLRKLPEYVVVKLQDWVADVEERGLEEVRKVPGYHDEPCKGQMAGLRSIRLSRAYRAYYSIHGGRVEFVLVERVDKHEY